MQINELEEQRNKLTDQSENASQVDREDLARKALTRRAGLDSQLGDLRAQCRQLQDVEKLTLATQRMQAKVDSFRTRKETAKAASTVRRSIYADSEACTLQRVWTHWFRRIFAKEQHLFADMATDRGRPP